MTYLIVGGCVSAAMSALLSAMGIWVTSADVWYHKRETFFCFPVNFKSNGHFRDAAMTQIKHLLSEDSVWRRLWLPLASYKASLQDFL